MSCCYFCESINHLSENCHIYVTIRSRYLKLKNPKKLCLCDEKDSCKCKIICEACLQQHHVALCPKIDPIHRYRMKSAGFDFPILEYHIIRRFFNLCNPVNKIKLQLTSKRFLNIEPVNFKLCNRYPQNFNSETYLIFNDYGSFYDKNISVFDAKNMNHFFNLRRFSLYNQCITKADLDILSHGDPEFVHFYQCIFEDEIVFKDVLEIFPYASDFTLTEQELPKTWLQDLISAKKYVSYKTLQISIPEEYMNFSVTEFIKFFDANENLNLYINIKNYQKYFDLKVMLMDKFKHIRFSQSNPNNESKKCDFYIKTEAEGIAWLHFNRKFC